MRKSYRNNRAWSDQYMDEVKRILSTYFSAPVTEGSLIEDLKQNTDLKVLCKDNISIAVRIRRQDFIYRYGNEFTIRRLNHQRKKTEFQKIIEGWGDYFFYGFADECSPPNLLHWYLADLSVFREVRNDPEKKRKIQYKEEKNHDGSPDFYAFKWEGFPANFIVQKYTPDIYEDTEF
jgi:hypothetical protein